MWKPLLRSAAFLAVISAAVVSASVQVTLISDIHLDPNYGTPAAYSSCTTPESSVWGVAGCEASPQLTQRSLDDVSEQNTSFIFHGGDWQRHRFYGSGLSATSIFGDLSERFRNVTVDGSLGEVAFCTALGNNDVVPNYFFALDSSMSEQELFQRVQAMETVGLLTSSEAGVMAKCGYYTHEMATVNVIVLHTLLWTFRLRPELSDSISDPCNQFAFLESELQKVRSSGKRAIILGHIPPGLNTFNVLRGGFNTLERDIFWKPEYQRSYDAIIYAYRDVVTVQIYGHTHRFTLQVFPENGVLSLIMPAISPIYNNNPSYLLANFSERDWSLQDVQIRYVTQDGMFHAGMSAKRALKISADLSSLPQLRASIKALATDDEAWENYLRMFCGGELRNTVFPRGPCDARCRYVVVCSMLESNHSHIQRCVADFLATSSDDSTHMSSGAMALIIICSIIGLDMSVMLVLMARSGQTTLACSNFQSTKWWRSLLEKQSKSSVATGATELHAVM
ncbi:hypothetical protein ABL78_8154 [Leptomonas seymouri]|uniref:Calcineurin-like phosphoesterase domain-containing protein n=1 Tax=Leptomonas seymouri TaxID=5684 RepID=A0A0N1HYJ4_LEPSE|nr:hypothetical protein ABL78_8154 [Leptomonas seymouri]|eukprot:KPI82834.1 hypothetical protein ABL78_8154 [Leptomonas seymouri]